MTPRPPDARSPRPAVRPPLWTPTFTLLTLANLGTAMVFYVLMPTMATYAQQAFGASTAQAGMAASAFLVGAVIGRPLAGWLLSAFPQRRVLLWAALAYAAVTAAYFAAPSFGAMLAVRVANGLGFGVVGSALAGVVLSSVPAARRGEGSGWFGMGVSVATGLGPFLGLLLLNGPWGMPAVFGVTLGFAVWCLIASVAACRQPDPHPGAHAGRAPMVARDALPIAGAVACTALAFSGVLAFLNTFVREAHLEAAAAWYFPVYAAAIVATRPVAGRIQDRTGDDVVLVPAFALACLGTLITASATGTAALLAGAAILGLGYGTLISAGQAFAVRRVPRHHAGVAVASFFLLVDGGTGVGPVLLGALVPALGLRGVLVASALIVLMGLAVYWFLARRTPPLANPSGGTTAPR